MNQKKTLEEFFHYSHENLIFRGVGKVLKYIYETYLRYDIWNVFQINVLLEL